MFSFSGVNFCANKDELEWRYIIRRLMAYGVPSSGDLATDKQLLQKVERGALEPVQGTKETKVENFVENVDYVQNSQNNELSLLAEQKTGAEQLGILNKLKLGLI